MKQRYTSVKKEDEKLNESDEKLRDKRAQRNGQPFNLYVEVLIVTDYTIYEDHQNYAQTNDQNLVFLYMRIYFAHYINEVLILSSIYLYLYIVSCYLS